MERTYSQREADLTPDHLAQPVESPLIYIILFAAAVSLAVESWEILASLWLWW
jgi:hypothetical protein